MPSPDGDAKHVRFLQANGKGTELVARSCEENQILVAIDATHLESVKLH